MQQQNSEAQKLYDLFRRGLHNIQVYCSQRVDESRKCNECDDRVTCAKCRKRLFSDCDIEPGSSYVECQNRRGKTYKRCYTCPRARSRAEACCAWFAQNEREESVCRFCADSPDIRYIMACLERTQVLLRVKFEMADSIIAFSHMYAIADFAETEHKLKRSHTVRDIDRLMESVLYFEEQLDEIEQ